MAKTVCVRTDDELIKALGLTPAEGVMMVFRSDLNSRIIKIAKQQKLDHSQLAAIAKSSKTRMKALLNRDISNISTDLMLQVVSSLGYKATLKITRAA